MTRVDFRFSKGEANEDRLGSTLRGSRKFVMKRPLDAGSEARSIGKREMWRKVGAFFDYFTSPTITIDAMMMTFGDRRALERRCVVLRVGRVGERSPRSVM